MKKLLFLLAVILLFSCEKEQDHCWKCYKDIDYNEPDSWSSQEFFICGQTRDDINDLINANTFNVGDTKHSMRCTEIDDNSPIPE